MIDDDMKRRSRTKADLVDLVYRSHGGLTKHEAAEIVDSIFRTVKTSLLDGNAVKIQNFGVFEVVERQGRMGVDPASGKRIFIPPRNGLSFRPAHRLKNAVVRRGSKT
ncbi:MAG: HU family DNA-binding protein [Acidobacteriota bacterium]|nr:HU family DNA-binding protein [Acidobacteriota bacterium]